MKIKNGKGTLGVFFFEMFKVFIATKHDVNFV